MADSYLFDSGESSSSPSPWETPGSIAEPFLYDDQELSDQLLFSTTSSTTPIDGAEYGDLGDLSTPTVLELYGNVLESDPPPGKSPDPQMTATEFDASVADQSSKQTANQPNQERSPLDLYSSAFRESPVETAALTAGVGFAVYKGLSYAVPNIPYAGSQLYNLALSPRFQGSMLITGGSAGVAIDGYKLLQSENAGEYALHGVSLTGDLMAVGGGIAMLFPRTKLIGSAVGFVGLGLGALNEVFD